MATADGYVSVKRTGRHSVLSTRRDRTGSVPLLGAAHPLDFDRRRTTECETETPAAGRNLSHGIEATALNDTLTVSRHAGCVG